MGDTTNNSGDSKVIKVERFRRRVTLPIALLTVLTLAALLVRIIGVGVPPLLDGESIIGIAATSLARTGQNVLPAGHPYQRGKLLTALVAGSITLFGETPFSLRLPVVIAGTATVPVVYLLGRDIFDTRVALFAATLQAFALVNIAWARTARFYTLLQLSILIGLLCYFRARDTVTVDYLEPRVTIDDKRRAVLYLAGLAMTVLVASQIHRGWLLLPAVAILHASLRDANDPIRVMQGKALLWVVIVINGLFIAVTQSLLVPAQLFELVGLGSLNTVAVWEHPLTGDPPVFFYFTYFPVLAVLALAGTFALLLRRTRGDTLVLVGLYAPLFLFTYFGTNFRFIWRPRYLLLTLPFFFLLAAAGISVLVGRIEPHARKAWHRVNDMLKHGTLSAPISSRGVLIGTFAVLLLTTPVGQGVQFTSDPYALSRIEEPRANYKGACEIMGEEVHSGDIVITNRPNQLYYWIEKVDYRGNTYSEEWTAVPGRGHYTGAIMIDNSSEMEQVVKDHDRVWVVYNPFMTLEGESWIKNNLNRYGVADSPFQTRFPQGLYKKQSQSRENEEKVYIYTKGIKSSDPNGEKALTKC